MNIPAELHLIGLIVGVMCVAYFAIYPRLKRKTLSRMMFIDLILLGLLLAIAGSVYADTGTGFSLLVVDTNWWVFTLVVSVIVETPLFVWFCRKWNIDFMGDDE